MTGATAGTAIPLAQAANPMCSALNRWVEVVRASIARWVVQHQEVGFGV